MTFPNIARTTSVGGNVRRRICSAAPPVTMHLEVRIVTRRSSARRHAGAQVTLPPFDAFWGARYAQIVDPFGHAWSFAHPLPENKS